MKLIPTPVRNILTYFADRRVKRTVSNAGATPEALTVFSESLRTFRNHGWEVRTLVDSFTSVLEVEAKPEHLQILGEILKVCNARNLKTDIITGILAELIRKGVKPEQMDLAPEMLVESSTLYGSSGDATFRKDYKDFLYSNPSEDVCCLLKEIFKYQKERNKSPSSGFDIFFKIVVPELEMAKFENFKKAVKAFIEKGLPIDETTKKLYETLNLSTNPKYEELFFTGLAHCSEHWDDYARNFFANNYLELVRSNPSDEVWDFYVTTTKKYPYWLHTLTRNLSSISGAKPSPEQLEKFKDILIPQLNDKRDIDDFIALFVELVRSKANPQKIQSCSEKYFELFNCLTVGKFVRTDIYKIAIEEPSDDFIRVYRTALSIYAKALDKLWSDPLTNEFSKLGKGNPTCEQITNLETVLKKHINNPSFIPAIASKYADMIKILNSIKPCVEKLRAEAKNEISNESNRWLKDFDNFKEQDKNSGIQAPPLIEVCNSLKDLPDNQLSLYNEMFPLFTTFGLTSKSYIHFISCKPDQNEFDELTKTIKHHKEKGWKVDALIKEVSRLSAHQHNHNEKYLIPFLRNYNRAFETGYLTTDKQAEALIIKTSRELIVQTQVNYLLRNSTKTKTATKNIESLLQSDSVPYALRLEKGSDTPMNPQARQAHNETLQIYSREYDFYRGFSALTFDCRRPPTKEPPLLARFGNDVAISTKFIHAKDDLNGFPGRGLLISGLLPEKIFVADSKNSSDPYHHYKKAWPWANEVFDDISNTHFIFTRGMIIVSCPGNEKYVLDGVEYSYVVLNDHHNNFGMDAGFLVPTEVIKKKIAGTTYAYEDFGSPQTNKKDINEAGFRSEDLISAAKEIKNANVLNLGWGSNIGGGLCNAYPVDSSPYHMWEQELRKHSHTEDSYKHVHKSHITGRYLDDMTPEMDRLLIPLRHAHDQVFTVTTRYQNLLDILRLAKSFWNKGETMGDYLEPLNRTDDDLFEREEKEQFLETSFDSGDLVYNPASNRMLVEAYKWHSGIQQGIKDRNKFPVLVIAETRDYWSKPSSPIVLDTYDLILKVADQTIDLPDYSDGTGEFESKLWNELVMPLVQDSTKDLRFYDRRDLGLN